MKKTLRREPFSSSLNLGDVGRRDILPQIGSNILVQEIRDLHGQKKLFLAMIRITIEEIGLANLVV